MDKRSIIGYILILVGAFLGVSFVTGAWNKTWLIIVVGILGAVIAGLATACVAAFAKKKKWDKGLATCSGDKDFYIELFEEFTKLDIKSELTSYLKNSDNLNYCIRVHGFKNTAYSIGAVRLGDLAYNMEVLTREEMPDNIDELQDSLFEQYDRICQRFESIKN